MQAIRHFSTSSSFFVGIIFTSLVAIGIFFISYFMRLTADDFFFQDANSMLAMQTQHYVELESEKGIDGLVEHLKTHQDPIQDEQYIELTDKQGKLLFGGKERWPGQPKISANSSSIHTEVDGQHYLYQMHQFSNGEQLLIAKNTQRLKSALWIGNQLGWLMITLLLSISCISFVVAYYVVTRINRISDTADRIIDTVNLSERLPVDSSWDDLSKLSISLNRMFSELEQQVNAIKTVTDNIAHDLRTPLTRVRNRLESMPESDNQILLLHDVDLLLGMFNGLLRIAELENNRQRSGFSINALSKIIEDVAELYSALAEEKLQRLEVETTEVDLDCDRDLVFQAVANVLDNAIKFTPENGYISVNLYQERDKVIIEVIDSGPGISENAMAKVTRRFYRHERSRTTPGFGLGMSLVQAIMHLHNGYIELDHNKTEDNGSGLICRLVFKSK